ncbi:hypothetical protein [Streptomyces sp. WM6386]|uniref:hypothetical protein n=1 Tax=Streptomyces sp. WM6386 TaxID=1415558 RepID=UPI0006195357|nr:hypothetical protein [Streptomyces sp. WM6386]KKD06552.1 hypothetical protein TN53_18035 [Streptomyces sp. WM6386]
MKTSAVLLCAAVFLVAGCRVGGNDSAAVTRTPAGTACSDGEIRWAGVSEERRLIAVSRPVEVGEKDGKVRFSPVRVRELEPRVEMSGEGPSAGRLFASLGKRLGWEADTLARPGRSSAVRERDDVADFEGGGTFVFARAVRSVEASFTADCSGTPVYGSVSSWHGSSGASLACGVEPSVEGADEPWIAEAYELGCGS